LQNTSRWLEESGWEVEFAVVIGKRGRYIPEENSLSYVAGYCTFNGFPNASIKWKRGGQWTKGNGCGLIGMSSAPYYLAKGLRYARRARMVQLIRTDKRGACRNVRSGLSEKGQEAICNQFHCQGQQTKLL